MINKPEEMAEKRRKQIEILAPAGSLDILKLACMAGADAVYAGGSCFGARAFAHNFTEEELLEGIDFVHLHGKKLYLTVNTLVKEKEFDQLYSYLLPFYREGLDAVIVQDMGVMEYIKEQFPGLAIHASTQMTVTGALSAAFLEKNGVTRVVPARELSLAEIRRISDETDLEIECFVHGALCYCYSGQCLLSSMIGGRSGNRGQCAQPCRLPWKMEGEKKSRDLLSLKDLCAIDLIPELIDAGITSFKIEGRMKQASYVETVTSMYRKYTDLYFRQREKNGRFSVTEKDRNILLDAYRRRGYTDGYYTRHNGRQMLSLKRPAPEKTAARAEEKSVEGQFQEKINGKLILSAGKRAKLILYADIAGKETKVSVNGDTVQEALRQPVSEERLEKQLKKTGNTPFCFDNLEIEAKGNIFLPIQSVNALRRDGLEKLEKEILENFRKKDRPVLLPHLQENGIRHAKPVEEIPVYVSAQSSEQARAALSLPFIKRIYLQDRVWMEKETDGLLSRAKEQGVEMYFSMAAICRAEAERFYQKNLAGIAAKSDGAMARNLEGLLILKKAGFHKPVDTASSAYHWNRRSQKFWRDQGETLFEAPLELNARELSDLDRSRMILPVYGYIPVMTSAGCIRGHMKECTGKSGWTSISDRYNKKFMVRNECLYCYNVIYNADPLVLADQSEEIRSLAPAALLCAFTWESGEKTEEILSWFRNALCGKTSSGWKGDFTRGHFKRGVK